MKKIWLVAQHEYRRHVFTKRFLFGLLSVPLVCALMVGLILLIMSIQFKGGAVGYVDKAGVLSPGVTLQKPEWPEKQIQFISYPDESAAKSALESGSIQVYYVLSADYRQSGALKVMFIQPISESARSQFYDFLGASLLKNTTPEVTHRLLEGSQMTIQSLDGSRSLGADDWFTFMVPMLAGIGFIIAMFTAGGYLMQAVVEEKENRTMEVMVTSLTPGQLMGGKIIGDTAIGLTQLVLWISFIVVPILIARSSVKFLQAFQFSGQTVAIMLFVMLPSFVVVCALMAMIGATVSESREGQQMTGLISLPTWIPYMLTMLLMDSPNSPIAVLFSFLPLTAPVTMLVRDGMTILPVWQIAVASGLQILYAAGIIWLAGKAFRVGMLRYGKKVSLRDIFSRATSKELAR